MPSKLGPLGVSYEIYSRQALDRGRWPQNEREPRGCILERVEGDRARAAHDLVGVGRRNRCSAATRQSVIGPSAFRARILSHPTFPRKGAARRNSRDDRRHCACFFLSLCGQLYRTGWIGHAISSGCIRLTNEDVIELYRRVKVGALVVLGTEAGCRACWIGLVAGHSKLGDSWSSRLGFSLATHGRTIHWVTQPGSDNGTEPST